MLPVSFAAASKFPPSKAARADKKAFRSLFTASSPRLTVAWLLFPFASLALVAVAAVAAVAVAVERIL
jgi:anti-sigma-K factor RskA